MKTDEREGHRELEELLDAIRNGEVNDEDDLTPHETTLLMTLAPDGEELEDLIDRIRDGAVDET